MTYVVIHDIVLNHLWKWFQLGHSQTLVKIWPCQIKCFRYNSYCIFSKQFYIWCATRIRFRFLIAFQMFFLFSILFTKKSTFSLLWGRYPIKPGDTGEVFLKNSTTYHLKFLQFEYIILFGLFIWLEALKLGVCSAICFDATPKMLVQFSFLHWQFQNDYTMLEVD